MRAKVKPTWSHTTVMLNEDDHDIKSEVTLHDDGRVTFSVTDCIGNTVQWGAAYENGKWINHGMIHDSRPRGKVVMLNAE